MNWKKGPVYFVTRGNAEYNRCAICHKKSWVSTSHSCIACGIPLCNNCYHAGFCKEHLSELELSDRLRVEQLAQQGQLSWLFFIIMFFVTIINSINIANSVPANQAPGVIMLTGAGSVIISLLVPTVYDQFLRRSFWKVVGKYQFITQEEKTKSEQKGEATEMNPPADKTVKVCDHCGWMLMATDRQCPRCKLAT